MARPSKPWTRGCSSPRSRSAAWAWSWSTAPARGSGSRSVHSWQFFLRRQAVFFTAGIAIMLAVSRVDYRVLRRFAPHLMAFAVALLFVVLFVSDDINGARRWIDLGPVHMQPSEIAKIALAVFLAATLARRGEQIRRFKTGFLPPMIAACGTMALVLLEKDLGHHGPARDRQPDPPVRRWDPGELGARRDHGRRAAGLVADRQRRLPPRAGRELPVGRRLPGRAGPDRDRLGRPVRARARQRPAKARVLAREPHRLHPRHDRRGARARRDLRDHRRCSPCWSGAGSSSPARPKTGSGPTSRSASRRCSGCRR